MTVEKRLEALVIQWLAKYQGIEALTARIDNDDWDIQTRSVGGCETCAWSEDTMVLTIWYSAEGDYRSYVEIDKDPLSFLLELLKLEDENK